MKERFQCDSCQDVIFSALAMEGEPCETCGGQLVLVPFESGRVADVYDFCEMLGV